IARVLGRDKVTVDFERQSRSINREAQPIIFFGRYRMCRYRCTKSVIIMMGFVICWFGSTDRIRTAFAQTGAPPQTGTPLVLPRPDFHFQGAIGRTYLDSDKAEFPQPAKAPKGAPNIVLILLDDAGFGQFGTFGGGIPSPTMDKLAGEGLRYNRFHTTALC